MGHHHERGRRALAGLIPETLWIRPIFQWRVHQIDAADPLWDDMAFLEVSLLKGFAFDFAVQESESYSIVIDTRFTQPPHEFRVGVGLDRITFEIADTVTDVGQLLLDLLGGGVGADTLADLHFCTYAITIQNQTRPEAACKRNVRTRIGTILKTNRA